MCVIIYNPVDAEPITKEEISDAWDYNPDGAGFAIQRNGKVQYERGFMNKKNFINEVMKYIGKYNTVLHFRISTSSKVNKLQCHPYERSHIESLRGTTNDSVICMNGIVSCDYVDRKKYNDTMNYIIDHQETFKNINQHIIDMIGDVTGSKWFVMKPNSIFKTSDFQEYEGRFYSNKNHIMYDDLLRLYRDYYDDAYDDYYDDDYYFRNSYKNDYSDYNYDYLYKTTEEKAKEFFSPTMIKKLKKVDDGSVWQDIIYFIDEFCLAKYKQCYYCDKCFNELDNKKDIIKKLEDSFGLRYGLRY